MDHIPVAKLLDAAGFLFGVTPEVIWAKSRKAQIFRARSAVALLPRVAGYSYHQIGRELGGRDHSTSMSACDWAETQCGQNARFKRHCDSLFEMARRFREASNDIPKQGWDGHREPAKDRLRMG